MALKLKYEKVATAEAAYQAVKKNITPEAIKKFNVNADMDYDDQQKKIVAKGTGFTLVMSFEASDADIDLDLSFLLKPLKGKILDSLERQLKKIV